MQNIAKPVHNGYITADFYEKRGDKIHGGYDIGCKTHPCYIHSICDAEIVQAGWSDTFGYRVWVRPMDLELRAKYPYIVYAHLEKINVALRGKVYQNEVIGIMGNTGLPKGVHLHIEARTAPTINGSSIDIVEIKELYT